MNTIRYSFEVILSFFPTLPSKISNKISSVINTKLLTSDENNNDLFGLLFTDPNIHEQLLLKGVNVVNLLSKLKLLVDKDIERLYSLSFCSKPESELFKSIFSILHDISKDLELSQQKIIFNKIISLPYEKIRYEDLTLMTSILQNIKDDNEFKEMAQTFLDYYYNYIIIWKRNDKSYLYRFARILTYAKTEDNYKYMFCHYFEKVINDLNEQTNLNDYKFFSDFLYCITTHVDNKNEEIILKSLPFIKNKFREIFLKNNKNMEIIADKLLNLNNKNNQDEISNENNITKIIDIIIKLVDFIEEKNFYNLESMKKLSEYYIFGDVLRKKRSNF